MKNPIHDASSLSYGQKALWYLNQIEPDSTAYHLGACLKLTGRLDESALAAAWADKARLRTQHALLDPFALKKSIEAKLRKFFTVLGNLNREATKP